MRHDRLTQISKMAGLLRGQQTILLYIGTYILTFCGEKALLSTTIVDMVSKKTRKAGHLNN